MRSPARFILLFLLAVIGVKVSEQAYRFVAFRDERRQVAELRDRLLDAGAELEVNAAEVRRLRDALQAEDARLEEERRRLMRLQHALEGGAVSESQYEQYRMALEGYNRHVVERNGRVAGYQELRDLAYGSNQRYDALADSMREIAARMGEPYYAVPTSVEAAMARGVIKPEP
jgi:hypothetical protein